MAAMWAVLTRLEEPNNAGLTLLQKLKLYDGKTLPGFTDENIKELKQEVTNEGLQGISPRYVQDKISNALVAHPESKSINPFMVLNELENGLKHHSLVTSDDLRGRYRELLGVVKEEYENVVKNEVQRAIAADEDALKRLCGNYIDNVKAYTQREKVKNKFTGQYEEPDERLMRSIEEKIDIPDSRKDDFRREMMNYIGALSIDGKVFDYKSNERLYKALQLEIVRGPEGHDQADQSDFQCGGSRNASKNRRGEIAVDSRLWLRRGKRDRCAALCCQHFCSWRCAGMKIDRDKTRFRQIVRGKIRENLKKYVTHGEMIGRKGKDLVSIPLPQLDVPHFRYGQNGRGGVGQGDGEIGQPIARGDQDGDGAGQAGSEAGSHVLEVEVPLDELAEMLGDELELPRIEPKGMANISQEKARYNSIRRVGPESLRHFKRTYVEALKRQIVEGAYNHRRPHVVPIREDRRYRSWQTTMEPEANAAILYMMDVSGSMTDEQKQIVRTEAFWIDTWLKSQYDGIERRYIIHDALAKEVDEHTFYHTRESGGTRISSAYRVCAELIQKHYAPSEWNIYCFQFSDGDNWGEDSRGALQMLRETDFARLQFVLLRSGGKSVWQRRVLIFAERFFRHPRGKHRSFGNPRSRRDFRFHQNVLRKREMSF